MTDPLIPNTPPAPKDEDDSFAESRSERFASRLERIPDSGRIPHAADLNDPKEWLSGSPPELTNPGAKGENLEARGQNPEAKGQNPEAKGQNPEAKGQNPEAKGQNPEAKGQNPEAKGQNPEAKGQNPEAKGQNPEAKGQDAPSASQSASGMIRPIPETADHGKRIPNTPAIPSTTEYDRSSTDTWKAVIGEGSGSESRTWSSSGSSRRGPFAMPSTTQYDRNHTQTWIEAIGESPKPKAEPLPEPVAPVHIEEDTHERRVERLRAYVQERVDRATREMRPRFPRLRKWAIRAALGLLALRLLFGLALDFAVDSILRETLGLTCTIGSSRVRFLTGDVVLEDVELAPLGSPEKIAKLGRADIEVSWTELPTIVIHRLTIDDLIVKLERTPEGTIPALRELLETHREKAAAAAAARTAKKSPSPRRRVLLEAARVEHVRLDWADHAVSPPVFAKLELDLRADNVATWVRDEPLRFALRLGAPGILDAFRLDLGSLPLGEGGHAFDLAFRLEGHPQALTPYFAPREVTAKTFSVELGARYVTRPSSLEDGASTGDLTVERATLKADDDEIGFERLVASLSEIASSGVKISSVSLEGPHVRLARRADGAIKVAGLALPDADLDASLPLKPRAIERVASFGLGFLKHAPKVPFPVTLDSFTIHGGKFGFRDEVAEHPIELEARDLEVGVRDLAWDSAGTQHAASIEARVTFPGNIESVALVGTAVPFGPEPSAKLDLAIQGASFAGLAPYLVRRGLEPALEHGTLGAHLEAKAKPFETGEVGVELELERLALADDRGRELAGIDRISIGKTTLDPAARRIGLGLVSVVHPRVEVGRDASGSVAFLGLRTRAKEEDAVAREIEEKRVRNWRDHPHLLDRIDIGSLLVSGITVHWRDETLGDPLDLTLDQGAVALDGVAVTISAEAERVPGHLHAGARLGPGLGRVALDADVTADAIAPSVSGTLALVELSAKPLRPYLELRGIEPDLDRGRFEARLDARGTLEGLFLGDARIRLDRVRLGTEDDELAAIDRLELAGARLAPKAREYDLGAVTIEGVRAKARRDSTGATYALGLRFKKSPASAGADASRSEPASGKGPPRVSWGEVTLRNGALAWLDETTDPPARLHLSKLDMTLGARSFDHEAASDAPPVHEPAPFKLHAELDRAVASLDAWGQLFPSTRTPVLNGHVRASGLTLDALGPYLARFGLAPALTSGELALEVEGSAAISRTEARATVALRDVVVSDKQSELAGVDRAALAFTLDRTARTVEITQAEAERPRLLVERMPKGEVSVLGLRFARRNERDEGTEAPASDTTPAAPTAPYAWLLGEASVHGLSVHWRDVREKVSLDLEGGTFELGATRLLAPGTAGPFHVSGSVAGLGELELQGTAVLDPGAPFLDATVSLSHLRGAPLKPYLAPRAEVLLGQGTLKARVQLEAGPSGHGGKKLGLTLSELELSDKGRARLLALDQLRLSIPRADKRGKVYALDDLSIDGLEGEGTRLADGRIELLGIAWSTERRAATDGARKTPGARPSAEAETSEASTPDESELAPLPQVTITQGSVSIRRFRFTDQRGARPDAPPPPFVLADAGASLVQPFLLSPDEPESATFDLEMHGKLEPAFKTGVVFVHLVPFDAEPQVTVSFDVEGISGPAIDQRIPSAQERCDLSSVQDGLAKGAVTLTLKRIRGRLDQILADPSATPLPLELSANFEARSTPDGPIVAGADEVRLDVASLDLATGETRVRALEIVNPRVRVKREDDGVRVFDVVWKKKTGTGSGSGSGETGEKRIDRISIADGDLLFEDMTVHPEASIELTGLEVEVLGASSRAFREHRPLRLRLGARGTTLFDELGASGTLSLSPKIEGDLDASVSGVKLAGLSGYTRHLWNLGLVEGRLDADSRLRFRSGRLQSTTRLTLVQAKVDEPPGGSILGKKMGVSVGTALAAIRDEDEVAVLEIPDRIDFDEDLHVVSGEIDVTTIVGDALVATLKGIATSMTIGKLETIGRTFKSVTFGKEGTFHVTREVPFATQSSQLSPAAVADLESLAKLIARDDSLHASLRAEISRQDEERSRRLGSPTQEERHDLIARLEARRASLDRRRADADALVRGALLSGTQSELGAARSTYAQAEHALLEVEHALDDLYDQEREGADRGADRRTREVEEALCEDRVEAVRSFLVEHGVPLERIRASRSKAKATAEGPADGRVVVDVGVREK
jgi:hypothetical protein